MKRILERNETVQVQTKSRIFLFVSRISARLRSGSKVIICFKFRKLLSKLFKIHSFTSVKSFIQVGYTPPPPHVTTNNPKIMLLVPQFVL